MPRTSAETPNQPPNMVSNWKNLTNTNPNVVPHKVNFINGTDVKFNHFAFFEDIAVEYAIVPTMIELMSS